MGIGTAMRSAVTSAINSVGSTVLITPFTQSTTDSGYSGQVPTDETPVNETAIPFDEIKNITKQSFGNLEDGTFQLALKSTAVFDIQGDTKYKITYNGEVHDITKINRFALENILIAWIITLSKRFD